MVRRAVNSSKLWMYMKCWLLSLMMVSPALNCLWPLTRNSLNLRLILKDKKWKVMLRRPSETCINPSLWHKHDFTERKNKWAILISLWSPASVVFTSRNVGRRNTYPCPSLTFSTSPWNKTRVPHFHSISKRGRLCTGVPAKNSIFHQENTKEVRLCIACRSFMEGRQSTRYCL